METRASQNERISVEYKGICSKLSKRLEEEEAFNKKLKAKIGACAKCSQFIEESKPDDDASSGSLLENLRSSEESEEIKQLERRIHDLEIELAQTKLELVESKCNNQALMHKLNLKN